MSFFKGKYKYVKWIENCVLVSEVVVWWYDINWLVYYCSFGVIDFDGCWDDECLIGLRGVIWILVLVCLCGGRGNCLFVWFGE